jgi:dUTP pyrophosphatase
MSLNIPIKQLDHGKNLSLPFYATSQSAGVDLSAAIHENIILKVGERKLIPAGISIALPVGYEAQVRPRSGLALKNGVTVLNTPGTIDADYRGEIAVILVNLGQEDFTITPAMRIAQMVIAPVTHVEFNLVDELPSSHRGEGGFGSTGC